MQKSIDEIASRYLPDGRAGIRERHIFESALRRKTVSRDLSSEHRDSLGERLADGIARVGGSWSFIIVFLAFLAVWVFANAWFLGRDEFDPYPFVFLNLVLSMLAAIQAPIIMMSQNRQAEHDRRDAGHDYEVNLKAEIEIMALHEKLDELRHRELVSVRDDVARVLDLLASIEARLGAAKG